MAEGKILQIYARIRNEDEIAQISKECERRGIAKSDFVLEAVEVHLASMHDRSREMYLIDERDKAERSLEASREIRDKAERSLEASEVESQKWADAHAVLWEDCDKVGKKLRIAKQEIERLKDTNDKLHERNGELDDARDANAIQRDKFKQKLEEVVQTHERLVSEVREMQSRGVFARASKLKRFNTAKYVIKTEEDNETSA